MNQVIGQEVAGRIYQIVTKVELKPGVESPVNMKRRTMNLQYRAQLTIDKTKWNIFGIYRIICTRNYIN